MTIEFVSAVLMFSLVFFLEAYFPFKEIPEHRYRQTVVNLITAGINAIVILMLSGITAGVLIWTKTHSFGLLNILPLPRWMEFVCAIFMFDAWMYLWHRVNHQYPILWRFHAAHHLDEEMEASTALRFHPIEIINSNVLNLVVIAVFGLSVKMYLGYRLLMIASILFHHSNINIPESADKFLRKGLVTPFWHHSHHAEKRSGKDTNYGVLFSFWDKCFKTCTVEGDRKNFKYGLKNTEHLRSLIDVFLSPFGKQHL